MHEFSICQTIVDTAIEEIEKHGLKPRSLIKTHVVVGKLRQLVPEYLQFAYETLTKNTIIEGSVLEISTKPIIGKCKKCGWEGEMSVACFRCQKCESNNAEIIGGRELYLKSLEAEEDE